jgi:hypothetical protein
MHCFFGVETSLKAYSCLTHICGGLATGARTSRTRASGRRSALTRRARRGAGRCRRAARRWAPTVERPQASRQASPRVGASKCAARRLGDSLNVASVWLWCQEMVLGRLCCSHLRLWLVRLLEKVSWQWIDIVSDVLLCATCQLLSFDIFCRPGRGSEWLGSV